MLSTAFCLLIVPAASQDGREVNDRALKDVGAKFSAQFGVNEAVEWDVLQANPFAFKNKRVAVLAVFNQMVGPNTALFGPQQFSSTYKSSFLLVDGVSVGQFTVPQTQYAIVLDVKDPIDYQSQSTPRGTFRGLRKCSPIVCFAPTEAELKATIDNMRAEAQAKAEADRAEA